MFVVVSLSTAVAPTTMKGTSVFMEGNGGTTGGQNRMACSHKQILYICMHAPSPNQEQCLSCGSNYFLCCTYVHTKVSTERVKGCLDVKQVPNKQLVSSHEYACTNTRSQQVISWELFCKHLQAFFLYNLVPYRWGVACGPYSIL